MTEQLSYKAQRHRLQQFGILHRICAVIVVSTGFGGVHPFRPVLCLVKIQLHDKTAKEQSCADVHKKMVYIGQDACYHGRKGRFFKGKQDDSTSIQGLQIRKARHVQT